MKQSITTDRAPAAIGPYSQAVKIGELVFTSGQIPLDPATGAFPEGGIRAQTLQALKNVQAVLEAAGSGREKIVKTTVFLQNMGDFAEMNQVYAAFFEGCVFPARSAVEAAALPRGALVEIEVIAHL